MTSANIKTLLQSSLNYLANNNLLQKTAVLVLITEGIGQNLQYRHFSKIQLQTTCRYWMWPRFGIKINLVSSLIPSMTYCLENFQVFNALNHSLKFQSLRDYVIRNFGFSKLCLNLFSKALLSIYQLQMRTFFTHTSSTHNYIKLFLNTDLLPFFCVHLPAL